MKKRIVIFGCNGNIGQYMVDYFLNHLSTDEYELIGVDKNPHPYIDSLITRYDIDINDKEAFNVLPEEGIYAVIDLIGPMPARMKGYEPEIYVQTNVSGTFQIFMWAISVHADRILYAKSFCDILKYAEKSLYLHVDMAPYYDYGDQHAVYCASQNAALELLNCVHSYYKIRTFIFRLPHIYLWSKNDSYCVDGVPHKMMHRIMIDNASEGKDVEVWGDASRKKDMIYVKDVCQAFYKACFVDRDYGFYNVGTGIGTTLLDQVKGMIQVFSPNQSSRIVLRPDKPDAPQYIMDITETVNDLGYWPQYPYIRMLEDMKKERDLGRF